MSAVPDCLHAAIAKQKHEFAQACASLLPPRNKLQSRKAAMLSAHAERIHAWCCLEYAIEQGIQPVSAGWDALRLGYIPDDWILPARFPGSAKA